MFFARFNNEISGSLSCLLESSPLMLKGICESYLKRQIRQGLLNMGDSVDSVIKLCSRMFDVQREGWWCPPPCCLQPLGIVGCLRLDPGKLIGHCTLCRGSCALSHASAWLSASAIQMVGFLMLLRHGGVLGVAHLFCISPGRFVAWRR